MKKYLIERYECRIANLKSHLETNGKYLTENEKIVTIQRIQDHEQFLNDLKQL